MRTALGNRSPLTPFATIAHWPHRSQAQGERGLVGAVLLGQLVDVVGVFRHGGQVFGA